MDHTLVQKNSQINGIHHTTGALYYPSTNGAIERAVQAMKKSLKSTVNEPGSIQMKLSQFLMSYAQFPMEQLEKHPLNCFLKDPSK